jgi:hypothetical protein
MVSIEGIHIECSGLVAKVNVSGKEKHTFKVQAL